MFLSVRNTKYHFYCVIPHGASVLVVEDDADLRYLFRVSLALAGFHVREAADGYLALVALEEDQPDAVVLDLALPRVSGFTVLDEIVAREDMRRLAVVVVTGLNVKQRLKAPLLQKPIDPPALVGAVRRAIRRAATA